MFDDTLQLGGRTAAWEETTPLLGSLAELDSLTIFTVIAALEKEFAIAFDDGDINAEVLATLGSLTAFIDEKQAT